MKQQTLRIDPEFKAQIPPLTEDERKQLEENILADGEILSPILVWNDTIVDGHNRYEILQNHPEIPFTVYPLTLENREQVLVWICKNQLGRRNLTPEQKKFLIGKQYDAEKHDGFHGNQHTLPASSGGVQNEHQQTAEKTCERIARENRVSSSSVRRAALFAQGVDLADKLCPGIRHQVLCGDLKAPDILFERLAKAGPKEYDESWNKSRIPGPRQNPLPNSKRPSCRSICPPAIQQQNCHTPNRTSRKLEVTPKILLPLTPNWTLPQLQCRNPGRLSLNTRPAFAPNRSIVKLCRRFWKSI